MEEPFAVHNNTLRAGGRCILPSVVCNLHGLLSSSAVAVTVGDFGSGTPAMQASDTLFDYFYNILALRASLRVELSVHVVESLARGSGCSGQLSMPHRRQGFTKP